MVLNYNNLYAGSDDGMVLTRTEIPKNDTWNVEALYSSVDEWKKEFESIKGNDQAPHWPRLYSFAGKLKSSSDEVAHFFDSYLQLERKLSKLATYAHMRLDEDLGNDESKQNFGLITNLYHDFQQEYSWVEPELLSLSEKNYQRLISHEILRPYRFFLEKLGRMRAHVLSKELEEQFALSQKAIETPYKAFGALNNADMTFAPAENGQGEKKELTTGTFAVYLRDSDRTLRKNAFINLHKGYEAHANTICELLQGQIQAHVYQAKAKKYKDCREAALFAHRIDSSVYDNLITVIHENLHYLHDYIHFRKEKLGLDELHPYDLYIPLVEETQKQTEYHEACQTVIQSVALLGDSYSSVLKTGLLDKRWVDPFENQRKRSGAYSGGCYDSMPYILMNYHGTLNDVLTLAHEAGHSMHSYLSRKNQPYIYADYPIFVAEVASTFNEQLLLNYLKTNIQSKKDKAFLINYEIEAIRTTIFRQVLFAEFEWQVHRWVEEGVTLTPALLKETWIKLNREYYGPELVIDAGLEYEWARIPHFYYNFYVYQYATGLSAALALFEKAQRSGDARDRYLQFLSSGSSRYPIDLLQLAGVDLQKKDSIESAMKHFAELLHELEGILAD
jgi:oligoendopeptidase F